MITITHELNRLRKDLAKTKKQLTFATAKALTATAKHVQTKQPEQLEKDLDKPTPFTKRGFYIRPATKSKLYAKVGIKDIQAKYLGFQIEGGTRRPSKKTLVAPAKQRRNKYGNLPRNKIKALAAKPNTFSGTINGAAGLWERTKKGKLKLLISYSTKHSYTKRYDFVGTARAMARKQFSLELQKAIREAMRTAK